MNGPPRYEQPADKVAFRELYRKVYPFFRNSLERKLMFANFKVDPAAFFMRLGRMRTHLRSPLLEETY